MTEQEAKTKWCPMYRVSVSLDGINQWSADNRGTMPSASSHNCIASDCMWWRVKPWHKETVQGDGYCGMAGEP